ncbi:uncharacterized protein PHACADRAFT_256964 [Phanerochaete carnosa HHB-10118-sp]|uniref:Uncharacterized protein n=1 Tax=Phanerochaete carnosa (strain HHB-10118-sp) TaxID=650164 RepID=K5W9T9_PHACS|nr:uncharacterized protein PHACADRAFT_256964 [Phanerochaete carnosa HHB-10118-sp]EKM55970.1 hypothetical protein PHACADRAFT_256964 [Phanerochaete carnosa HHB-10118-sp]
MDDEQHDLREYLRRHAYPGAVEVLDSDLDADEIERAIRDGDVTQPVWAKEEGGAYRPGLADGDTYVIEPTTLPDYFSNAYFVNEDASVPTSLPYRSRVRHLGFDRQYQDSEKVSTIGFYSHKLANAKLMYCMDKEEDARAQFDGPGNARGQSVPVP